MGTISRGGNNDRSEQEYRGALISGLKSHCSSLPAMKTVLSAECIVTYTAEHHTAIKYGDMFREGSVVVSKLARNLRVSKVKYIFSLKLVLKSLRFEN